MSVRRHEHVDTHDHDYTVRFVDLGLLHGFTADLTLDTDGLVVDYPELARRAIAVPG